MVSSTQTTTTALALAALFCSSSGHMIMANPPPFGLGSTLTNSPLTASNFPCQVSSDAKTFYTRSNVTTMPIGATQSLSFTGSAVHGGGSCQLAVTSDLAPSASTVWQVILSIEGGCPTKDGTSPSTYDFTIPDSITPGDYTFAWTWISKLAGQGEYYMNCAPITVTGAKSKRSDNCTEVTGSFTTRDTLPDLFKANLHGLVDCTTQSSFDIVYPDPGPNVEKFAANPSYYTPVGAGCGPTGTSNSSSGSGSSATAVASSAAVTSSSATGFVTSKIAATSSATAQPTSAAVQTSSIVAVSSAAPSKTAAATGSSSTGSAGSSGSDNGGLVGQCQQLEGVFNCVGGTSYQQCASGAWTAMQAVPAGTKCQEGQSTGLWARDEKRERIVRRHR